MQTNVITSLLLFLLVGAVICAKLPVQKRSLVQVGREPSKRTFCNAFTGCGRKRSSGIEYADYGDGVADSDKQQEASPEDPVDDLARDILAQARLWEALQVRNSMRQDSRSGHRRQARSTAVHYRSNSDEDDE